MICLKPKFSLIVSPYDSLLHVLEVSDFVTNSFSGKSKNTCWKMFIKYHHLLTGVGRDNKVNATEKFVCLLYRNEENDVKSIDNARYSLFVKAKRDLVMLPPTHNALQLHNKRSNYQAMIWLQADNTIKNLENEPTETIGWQDGTDKIEVV